MYNNNKVSNIEKEIRIEYSYNFGLPLATQILFKIWLEFDLLASYFDFCGVSQSKYFLQIFCEQILFSIFITMILNLNLYPKSI